MIPRQQLVDLQRRWVPPKGLEHSRPREVSLTMGGRALAVLSAGFVLGGIAMGIALLLLVARQRDDRERLRDHGVAVDAVVTRLWTTNGEERRHWVQFRLDVDNRVVERRQQIARSRWSMLREGSTIPVRYDPANPNNYTTFGRERGALNDAVPYAAGLGLMVFGALMSIPVIRQRRLLMEGRPTPGLVIKHRQKKSAEGAKQDEIEYEFLLLNGAAHSGKSSGSKASKTPEGQAICVLYEPDNPGHNAPYPLSLVRLAER